MSQRSIVPSEKQVLLSQQRTMEQRSSASSTTVRESHTRGQETRVAQQTFTSQQQSTNTTHRVQGAMLQQGHQIQQQGHQIQQQGHQIQQQGYQQQQQQMIMSGGRPSMVMDGSPPVFEQIFRNARFAQGGDAFFEGKVTGNPRPELSWTREGKPLATGGKYQMQYEPTSGKVSLLITHIGPGDEGEYTCTAVNKFGEAICTVYIQPEGLNFPQHLPDIHERSAHTELLSYQTNGNQQQQELYDVDFKVDTFEYRLLREVEFRESLTRRSQLDLHTETETETETDFEQLTTPLAPPQLVQQPRNTKLLQGSDATFQAKLQGNPKPKLTWFMNGARLNPSPRHQLTHSNHLATLKIRNVQPQDAGHYTLFAENAAGCIVSTAFLAVEPSGASNGFSPVDKRAQSRPAAAMANNEVTAAKVPRTASQERPGNDAVVMETGEPSGKALPPQFVRVPADQEVGEGKMVRFDCRITGRPYPDVLWYLNGHQILDDATHKILVNESGNHALMITGAGLNDSGVIQCVARNKGGEASFQVRLSVIEREQVVAPKFVERFTTVHVKEGEPVSLHARAIGTPIPKLTWQKDSVPVSSAGPELSIRNEGGYSALEIPCVRLADAGWYQCTAQNVAGSTATRARLFVDQQKLSSGQPKAMRFPKPTKVIQPQPEPEPEVIYLRHVERARPQAPRREEEERVYEAPIFILPLKDVNLAEGQRAYFEAKVNPAGDPNMRVDWFIDGKPLAASSRVTVTYRFGYISLLLIGVIREDSGVYTCRVSNEAGYADSSATMNVGPRATIESTSQHPESLEQIQMLEDYSRYQRNTSVEESLSGSRPVFVKPLHDLGIMNEGAYAHFEAQIQPVSDPYMRIEWYKDGRSITASSRITTIYNFGYVALNVMHLRSEDAGMYTVKAINRQGEAVSQASIQVATRGTVTGDLGIPEQQRYIERIEELEAYQLSLAQRGQPEPIEATSPPEFKSPIKDQFEIREGGFAHFEARLEPIGDPKLTVHWFKDGKPLEASSRITNFFNFGYVALTIKFITVHDRGVYTCVARNALGEAQTTAKLTVISKQDILLETQHPEGLEKIRYLEDDSRYARKEETVTSVTIKPRFLGPLKGTNKIVEGQKAHFEIRLEPQNDSTLRVEWYFNGKVLMQASRIHLFHDFGYVALDILDVRSEDAGTYTVVARNALGEAQSETTMVVETRSSVDTTSMHRVAYDKAQRLEESKFQEPQYDIEEISKSRPIFVIPLSDPHPVNEGNNVHLECRLEPMGDPTMRVEWYFNGKPITVGSRFKSYFDFGFVALDVIGVTALDSGEYTVRATNHLGTAHTSACVRIIGRSDIMTETQHEGAWEQIQMLEDSSRYSRKQVEEMSVEQIPLFTKPLHNIETVEGTNIHLECRLIPVGDSSMRIDWLVNGQPIRTGHRFRPAFDFDYVALDILSVYPEDSGVYTCRAYNKLGEAVTSSSVRVVAKSQLILESQHPGGLEKIQYLEDASRYKRREDIDEIVAIRPRFLSKPKPQEGLREGQNAHFECKLEPVQDPNLKVEWFKNNCPVTIGSRFRPIHDFGYVALDIIGLIAEDTGVYTCRAQNAVGVDETSATLSCKSSKQIVTEAQRENLGMEKLQYLEDKSKYHRAEESEEICTQAPVFTTSLKTIEIKEGQRAHFECRLIPVSDPTMRVEWFQNNVPLKSGSRFMETNSFGFVALDIMYAYPEDAGTYTCRASNALGQAVTSCQLNVHSKKSIVRETQNQTALSQIQYLEDTSRQQRPSDVDDSTTQAPVFTQPMKNLTLKENQSAHFEARLIPVGDSRLKVEWFKNGVPLQDANRISTLNDFGFVALDLKYVRPDDSGTYSCRATNELGQAVTSATLIVQSRDTLVVTETQHQTALDKLQYLEDTSRYQRQVEEDSVVTEKPKFVAPLNGPTKLVEGQNTHFECRIEPYPDPSMKVEWFHNGKALSTGHRFRTVHDFGFAALDILSVYPEDSGEYTIKATNKLGSCTSTLNIDVSSRSGLITESQHQAALDKILYLEDDSRHRRIDEVDSTMTDKPSFGRPLCNLNLAEGQSAHLEATLVPVNDPTMRVEWYHNGRPISQGHRFRTTYDFGFVALDILYAYAEDSGTYMCKAINANGETVTTCSVTVEGKAGLVLDTLDQQRLTKINELEAYTRPAKEDVEQEMQRPIFTTPLQNLENMKEGDHAHLECRLEPINDPKMRVEWYVNGMAIRTGHRFRATHDFGYVALDVLYTYPEDTGTYMCKAINALGEAVNTCTIQVASRKSIYLDSQHPEGWEKIRALESHTTSRPEEVEEPAGPPRFITELQGTTKLQEGQTAHLECRVEPVRDPKLRVEVFHNGKPLQSASRYHVTCDFGYIALDIKHVLPQDGGTYTVKVINDFGECSSSIDIEVEGRSGLILESQHPQGLDKIRELEDANRFRKEVNLEPVPFQRPVFTAPLQNLEGLLEGANAHLECRLIPVGDPSLKVEWFRNNLPLEDSSRIQKTHDFGYVALDISHIRDEDQGIYMCRATNSLGEGVTTASVRILSKASIMLETQHPEGMRKIRELEEGKAPQRGPELDNVFEKPVFTTCLTGPAELLEGQNAHFECRVVPVGDPSLHFEWYVNGVELKMGSRFRVTHDFGYVTLDVSSVIPEDSGVYMCKAINKAGEAVSTTAMKVRARGSILGDAVQPQAWQKIQLKETELNRAPTAYEDAPLSEAPRFIKNLVNQELLAEGHNLHLEAQVEPKTDPNLRVEWYHNGVQLMTGSRIRSTFDFGLVSLDIIGLRPEDSGIYVCKAVNKQGEAVSTCTIRVEAHGWLLGQALRPEALAKIAALEEQQVREMVEQEADFESPVFITHLNNVECRESETAHFECRVQPSKDPTMKIEWFVNGKPLPVASRFNATYDFGYVSLDISHVYAEDSGVYTCRAQNAKGQAVSTGTLRCTSRENIYLDTQHPQGKAGLEAVHEAEQAYYAKYQRQSSMPEASFPKPLFIIPLPEKFSPAEGQPLHMECHVEPKQDPKLRVEWFFNGKLLDHGSRFKMTNDFGFISLDLSDVYSRDQGVYTCRATNAAGEAFTTTTVYCQGKEGLIEGTQHPKGEAGLEQIQRLEDSLMPSTGGDDADEEGKAPVFTSQFQNVTNLLEGDIAHFEATLTPVGDQTMTVEWFYNGQSLKLGHRERTVHAFGMVVLEIIGTKVEDSGIYTCRATNKWGVAEISVTLECVDMSSGQKPEFTSQIQSLEGLKDGQSAHFECTLVPVGDPNLKVEWFVNGQPLRHSSRIKTVSDFGFVVLDIAYVQSHDSGEYICKASNKFGEDFTRATLRCVGKGGVYSDSLQPDSLAKIRALEEQSLGEPAPMAAASEAPKFVTQLADIARLVEGQSAHFEARLTPVNDPLLMVEWYCNGTKLPTGHRFRTFHDFGIVILDILYCYEEDSGVYECRAVNQLGQDSTRATLKCLSKSSLILDSQLPKGMDSLQKIQSLEDKERHDGAVEEVRRQAPVFTVPLNNVAGLREGENSHFEGRLTPTDDPKLKVEWFFNGKPLKTGSRIRTFSDFGFVILEISPVYPEDSGEYSCRATNDYGEAVTSATLKCQGKRNVIFESQLPKGMERTIERIAELEGLGGRPADQAPETDTGKPPEFLSQPGDLLLPENGLAHFETKLTPVGDPSLRVEWFHNGKPLLAGSRVKTISDFGFVILEVTGVYARDAGLYTCKASNKHGEASVSCTLQVKGRQGIILEPQLPQSFKSGTQSIQKLEENLYKRDEPAAPADDQPNPPRFVSEIQDLDLVEGQAAHFDCRVEPVGDASMRIEWFHNGRPLGSGSRIRMLDDFGFVVLDIDWTFPRDAGEYVCRATNRWGSATTKAKLVTKGKRGVNTDSQLPQGMTGEKLRDLERGPVVERIQEDAPEAAPHFTQQLKEMSMEEGETAHFECRVEPKTDANLRVEWYHNGKLLQSGHRFRTVFELGFVSLDILYAYPEDAGEYLCRAFNRMGEATTKASLTCKSVPAIIMQNQMPRGMKKSETLLQMEAALKKYTSEIFLTEDDIYDADKRQPPRFVTQIKDMLELKEMEMTKFECQLAPVGDPSMRVEWFFNGKPLAYKTRFTPIYDFGYVAMNFGWVYPEDSGEYVCRATNKYGMDETRAFIKTTGSKGIIYDSQLPKGMQSVEMIREMEASWQRMPDERVEAEVQKEKPVFVLKPKDVQVMEGEWARFCCRVTGYPRPRVMWILNGHTVINGTRNKLTYDGMWHLDIPKTRQYDDGKLEVVARNSQGSASCVVELKVTARTDDHRGVLKNSPKQYKDTPTYRKPEWVTRMEIVRAQMLESQQPPQFTTEIVDARVQEGEEAKFECFYAGNPKPDICWYFNNKLINPNPNVKIRIKDNSTSCTILEVDQDLEGEYMCKATSSSGAHLTKARLHVHELTGEARDIWLAKKAKVIEEKKRKEKEKEDKKTKKEKGAKLTKEEYLKQAMQEKEAAKVEEAKKLAAIEEAKQAKIEAELQPKPEVKVNKAKIQKEAMIEESLNKFVENQAIGLKALLEMTERKSLNVTEVVTQDKANEFSQNQAPFKEFLQIETMLKSGITVDQIVTLGSIGNLPTLTAPETQKALVRLVEDQGFKAVVLQEIVREAAKLAPEEPLGMKAVLKAIETKSAAVEDIVVMATHPEEFNLEAPPVPEMATVSTLLNEGISCEEMLTIVKAGELPALNLPENQWALIQIMEKLGQTAIVSQVIVEEPALNLPAMINEIPQTVEERLDKFITNQSIGLRALIDIAVQESVNVSEMATLDRVQEFQPGQAPFQEFLNVDTMLKSGVSVDQIVTLGSTGNLPVLTAPESQKALVRIVEDHGSRAITREIIVKEAAKLVPEEVIGLKAVLKAVKTKKADIKDIVEMATRPEEFGLDAQPVPEMASVSTLLHEGISCEEMLTIVKAGELPALQLPETQWPLIQIMERLGQTAIVSQTIIEEPTLGLKIEIPEMASSVESTVEPLSTAVVEVLPDVRAEPAHEFVTKIKDLEIKERQPAVFTADVSDDAAQVTWHKDGEPLDQANTERYEFVAEARKRSFTIRSVSLLDEGEYTCSLADQECTAELVVIELPPEITLRLQDVTVRRGEEASFEIELTKGDAKIQWFRNNEEIQLSEHIQLAIDGKRQRLVIYDSGPEDACEYSCVIGDQKSAARLQVLAPKVNFVAKLPEIVAAPMGQDVTFTVQLTGEDAEVTWMKNGEVVVDSDRIKLTRDGCARSLTITKAAIEDSAEYTCILEAMKTVTVLTVEVPKVPPSIPIDQVHAEVWVRRGEDAVIEVPFNGFPTPKAEWTFKGKAIRKTKKSVYSISETSAQLTLKLVDENEAGVYTCKLSNECGDVSVSVTIKLIEKPSSPSAPECLETADDSITIMWKPPGFNGGSVITNYIIEYQEKQTKKWVTANKDVTVIETTYMVTKLTHNTEYRFRVTAVNSAGPGTPSSESLLFKAAKAAIPEAPVIREPLKDVTAGLKETATLSCIIVGVPQPTLTWYKDDDEFVPKSSSYESGLARLILNNTTEESAGQYTCRASNDSGSVECSCTLTIQEAPKIVPEKKTKVYRLQVEKQWSITAKVTGLPRPDITWTKNGASFEGNTHYIADVEAQSSTACSTTLTIITTERTDTAKYTLTATNVAGTVTHDVTLKISDKPSKPQGPLVAKEVDKTSATMEWKPPLDDGGIELKGYVVEYSEIFTEQWKQVEEICPHPICHVQNLTEGLEYVFRVSAVNDVGTSEPLDTGAPVLIKSQFDTPSAPRGPLDISGMTDTSLVLKWLPPTSDGGSPLTEYLIERREVSKKAWQKVGAVDGKTTYIEACSLKKGTSYNFRITAQNQLGYGPAYSPEDVIVAGKRITPPSPPSNLQVADITSRSVTLQWAPPASTGGAELTGYIIEKMLQGTDKWEKVVTLDPSVTVHCIQNLKERSEFFFRVFTENPMGLSAPAESEKVSLKTHATVPSPPTSPLEVRPVGPNSIIVEWGIPESDGGAAIDGYIVAVRDSRKTMWMEVGQVGADTTRLIVKDMQEGHKYYVRVFARNEVGLSDPLETEEPVKVVRPPDYLEPGIAGPAHKDPTASLSLSTETLSSWMRDANMDADIRIYSRSSLLRRDEYFFRVWYYSRQLFK